MVKYSIAHRYLVLTVCIAVSMVGYATVQLYYHSQITQEIAHLRTRLGISEHFDGREHPVAYFRRTIRQRFLGTDVAVARKIFPIAGLKLCENSESFEVYYISLSVMSPIDGNYLYVGLRYDHEGVLTDIVVDN